MASGVHQVSDREWGGAGNVSFLWTWALYIHSWWKYFCHPPAFFLCCVQVEDLSDEVFTRRHMAFEQREKLRWPSWGKRKCCRRPTRWAHTFTHRLTNAALNIDLSSATICDTKMHGILHASGGLALLNIRNDVERLLYLMLIRRWEQRDVSDSWKSWTQCADCAVQLLQSWFVHLCACKNNPCESGMLRNLSAKFHGVCLFFHSRSGSRLSGSGGGMCTSGEESSVEWSGAQLDTEEQPSSEEWLVRSKATQLKP